MVTDLEARHYLVQSGIEKIIDRNLHSLNTVIGTSTFGNLKPSFPRFYAEPLRIPVTEKIVINDVSL